MNAHIICKYGEFYLLFSNLYSFNLFYFLYFIGQHLQNYIKYKYLAFDIKGTCEHE